ncbi:transmembrane protein 273 isoform X2 [Microcaecilia unicolor]|uniref:Transmembrane protein 273 isoform X2 n=1 Tax=Microcaecilia unicolor TaxID=1415580 RepID=A0A6P7XZC7_9AMPH|nr:transmembrane protein 273 isoform X2 [Microcaecilia unicolor]
MIRDHSQQFIHHFKIFFFKRKNCKNVKLRTNKGAECVPKKCFRKWLLFPNTNHVICVDFCAPKNCPGVRVIQKLEQKMTLMLAWIPVLIPFLLCFDFLSADGSATEANEEKIEIKYVVIGSCIGGILAIAFIAVKLYMIKKHMLDNDLSDSESFKMNSLRETIRNREKCLRHNEDEEQTEVGV